MTRVLQIKERESKEARLDLSSFCHVIELNAEDEWCDIEGATTFETFVAETAKDGFMPLVVPELKTITVGGTIVGIGIESSSFKHGFVVRVPLCAITPCSVEKIAHPPEQAQGSPLLLYACEMDDYGLCGAARRPARGRRSGRIGRYHHNQRDQPVQRSF